MLLSIPRSVLESFVDTTKACADAQMRTCSSNVASLILMAIKEFAVACVMGGDGVPFVVISISTNGDGTISMQWIISLLHVLGSGCKDVDHQVGRLGILSYSCTPMMC